jgi:hypothetical protein
MGGARSRSSSRSSIIAALFRAKRRRRQTATGRARSYLGA